jgi:hypothetical protein
LWVLSGELALCHASCACIIEVAGIFLEILLTQTTAISKIMRHVVCVTLCNLGGSNEVEWFNNVLENRSPCLYSAFCWCLICELKKMHGENNIKFLTFSLHYI